ncbi:MAG: methyltransferase [Nanoarchaeota archaeon]|nr:methyltransferase [Nanoarchaeota archaeon]
MIHRSFSLMGNVAIVNFRDSVTKKEKLKFAKEILSKNKSVKTVLEKYGNFKGRLRKQETRFISGEKTKEIIYKENNCVFRFNIDETYFSSRLSNERKEISGFIRKNEEVFVGFAGVGPFSIVIAKNSPAKKVYSNELNRKANKYSEENIKRNKVENKVVIVPGDFKKVSERLKKEGKKFDVIVMPRPQLKDSFLRESLLLSKKGTRIYYYDFCKVEDISKKIKMVEEEAKKSKKKIKIKNVKNAGEIAPYKVRVRIDFEVLN